jgi:hypothetical protein
MLFGNYNAKAGREKMQFAQKVISHTFFLASYEARSVRF